MDDGTECWLPVIDYEGLYEVSDLGRVRSIRRKGARGGLLQPYVSYKGYRIVHLHRSGTGKLTPVHHLVLAAFVGPRPPGHVARHLDDNHADNSLANLAYGTPAENAQDKLRNGRDAHARRARCKKGHLYDAANTKITTYPDGRFKQRTCRTCARALATKYRIAKKAFPQVSGC